MLEGLQNLMKHCPSGAVFLRRKLIILFSNMFDANFCSSSPGKVSQESNVINIYNPIPNFLINSVIFNKGVPTFDGVRPLYIESLLKCLSKMKLTSDEAHILINLFLPVVYDATLPLIIQIKVCNFLLLLTDSSQTQCHQLSLMKAFNKNVKLFFDDDGFISPRYSYFNNNLHNAAPDLISSLKKSLKMNPKKPMIFFNIAECKTLISIIIKGASLIAMNNKNSQMKQDIFCTFFKYTVKNMALFNIPNKSYEKVIFLHKRIIYLSSLLIDDAESMDFLIVSSLMPFRCYDQYLLKAIDVKRFRETASALVACKKPRSSELSDFEKGIIIGYHKCGRSLRDISSDLKYPKSTVAYVIKKWKVSSDCRNVPRVGRPTKLGGRDRRVLTREIRKNRTQPMALIREEFQQASGSIVSMNTIRKEAHLHGFHGRAAAHKPLITKSNRAARLMWCKSTSKLNCRSFGVFSAADQCKIFTLSNINVLFNETCLNKSLQLFYHSLLSFPSTSRELSTVFLDYILNHIEYFDNKNTQSLLICMLSNVLEALLFYFPKNQEILQIFLQPMIIKCMEFALIAQEPCHILHALSILFKVIKNEKLNIQLTGQPIFQLVSSVLQTLSLWYATSSDRSFRDNILNLNMNISLNYHAEALLSIAPLIIQPVVNALNGNSISLTLKDLVQCCSSPIQPTQIQNSSPMLDYRDLLNFLLNSNSIEQATNLLDESVFPPLSLCEPPRNTLKMALVNVLAITSSISQSVEIDTFLEQCLIHFTVYDLVEETSAKRNARKIRCFIIVDAISNFMSCSSGSGSDSEIKKRIDIAIKALKIIIKSSHDIFGIEKAWKLTFFEVFSENICQLCYKRPCHQKLLRK
ncbi:transposable element Tc1 transposase [Caerostris extrusa]|uniref:Transposable element Tc1 transposase n=1 Tax=Caerostris extrusa TaxID=172846 RepID=A0AAV4Y1J4_CAEEX|nr:transposable element Tc1 transposase [Caerostris extrusa]